MKATLYGLTKNKNDIHVKSQLEKMLAQVSEEGAAVIDGANIAAESIYGKSIVAGSIEATQIKAGAITSDHITANGIVADKIKTGILRSTNGASWLNLNDGTFSYANGNFTFQNGKMVVRAQTIELGGEEVPTKTQTEEYANSLGETLQGQIDTSIKSTEVEYYSSTSSTSPVGGTWSTTAPAWQEGRFMWSRTKITPNKGSVIYKPNATGTNISGATGNSAKIVTVTPSAQLFWRNQENAVTPATITVDGSVQNTTISAWQYSVNGGSFTTTLPTGVTRSGNKVTLTGTTVTARTIAIKALDASGNTDTTTIAMVQDGEKGVDGSSGPKGENAIVGILTNESITVPASESGAVTSFAGATGTFEVYDGITRKTGSGVTYSVSGTPSGITVSINATTGVYTISAMTGGTSVLSGNATLQAVYNGVTIQKILTVTKAMTGKTGATGSTGASGSDAKIVTLTSSAQIFAKNADGVVSPTNITVEGVSQNTSISAWEYSVDGGTFSSVLPTGLSRTGNVVSITGSSVIAKSLSIRAKDASGVSDVLSIAVVQDGAKGLDGSKGASGADAYTVVLSNEAHTFAGNTASAIASSVTVNVVAYKGATRVGATIGTISGAVTGMSTSIATNGTTTASFTVSVTTAMSATNGLLTIPITVDGKVFSKTFSFALALKGADGANGSAGADAKIVIVNPSAQIFTKDANGNVTPSTITIDGTAQNVTISAWEYSIEGGAFSTSLPTGLTRSGNKVTITGSSMTAKNISVRASGSGVSDTTTIAMVQDGAKGSDGSTGAKGENSIVGYLTNESVTLGASSTGVVSSFVTASGTFRVFDGTTEVTTNAACVFSLNSSTGVTLTINSSGVYTVTAMSADTATAEFKAVYKGITLTKAMSLSKSRVGATGSQGAKGEDGKGISSAIVTYQNHTNGTTAPTGTWSNSPSPVKGQYLWTRTVTTYTEGNPITTYAVAYNALDGQRGETGATGGKGTDGTGISSTVIRYFQSTSGTTTPSGDGSTTPPTPIQGQYNWTRTVITYTNGTNSTAWSTSYNAKDGLKGDKGDVGSQGPQGPQGIQGPTGANGTSQYIHIRYSTASNGNPMTTTPSASTMYIGIANTTSSTAPTGYASYTWSLYKGEKGDQGVQGPAGINGQPTYTWIKYADTDAGVGMSDSPIGKKYIGMAFNKTTATESTTASQYTWSLMPQNIEIGGRNLLRNSEYWVDFWLEVGGDSYDGNVAMFGPTTRYNKSNPVSVEPGKEYTVSVDVKVDTPESAYTLLMDYFDENNTRITYEYYTINLTDNWTRFSQTFRVPNNSAIKSVSFGPRHSLSSSNVLYMRHPKIEKGNIATDWTEAPEDVEFTQNKKVYNPVRYIRDWLKGSSANTSNHWYEIMANDTNGTNVAQGKTVTTNGTASNLGVITDGLIGGTYSSTGTGKQYVEVDLGSVYYNIASVSIWHYYPDNRTYYETRTEVSEDRVNWYPVFDSLTEGTYAETESGKTYPNTRARAEALISAYNMSQQLATSTSKVVINGGNITAGTVKSANSDSWINLDNGQFSFGKGNMVWNGSNLTVKGNIDASSINTGTLATSRIPNLSADKITVGTLKDKNNKNNINLDTGTFSLANGNIVYNGSTLSITGGVSFSALDSTTQANITNGAAAKSTLDSKSSTWDTVTGKATPAQAQGYANTARDEAKEYVDKTTGNLVNNPAVTGVLKGWSASGLSVVNKEFEGVTTQVIQSSVSADTQNYSDWVDVDPSKAYEVSMWIQKSANAGMYYVGLNVQNSSGTNVGFVTVNKNGTITNSSDTNFYFQSGSGSTSWIRVVGYIMPVGTNASDMANIGTTNSAIMKQNTSQIRIRFLNWANAGTTRQLWVANPKFVEVDPNAVMYGATAKKTVDDNKGKWDTASTNATNAKSKTDAWTFTGKTTINGGQIEADTIKAAQIAANTITATQIASRTITADRIATNAITANEINVANLSALSANLGNVTAGTIKSTNGLIDINLNTGVINLGQPLTINFKPIATKEDVDGISFGGRNYFTKKTNATQTVANSSFSFRHDETPNGFKVTGNSSGSGQVRINNVITGNGWWTVSFDVRGSQSVAVGVTVDICDLGFTRVLTNSTNTYERRSVSVYVNNYSESVYNFVDFGTIAYAYFWVDNIKVEKGNKATDWTEAPEDVEDRIGQKADAEATNAELEGIKSALEGTVSVDNYEKQMNDYSTFLETVQTDANNAKTKSEELDTLLNDPENGIVTNLGSAYAKINSLEGYLSFDGTTNTLTLARTAKSSTKIMISDTSIDFMDGTDQVASITNQYLKIQRGIFASSVQVSKHIIMPDDDDPNHLVFTYLG